MTDKNPTVRRFLTFALLMAALFLCIFVMPSGQKDAAFNVPMDEPVRVITLASPTPPPSPEATSAFRDDRKAAFEDLENALSMIAASAADPALLDAARDELTRMTDQFETVCRVETALCAMGYPDALCAADEKTVTVFLQSPISDADSLLITDLIVTWTQLPSSAVLLITGV